MSLFRQQLEVLLEKLHALGRLDARLLVELSEMVNPELPTEQLIPILGTDIALLVLICTFSCGFSKLIQNAAFLVSNLRRQRNRAADSFTPS